MDNTLDEKKRIVLRMILNIIYFVGGFFSLFLSAYINDALYVYFGTNMNLVSSYIVLPIGIIIIIFSLFIIVASPLAVIYFILIKIKYISSSEFKEFIYNEKSYYGKIQNKKSRRK